MPGKESRKKKNSSTSLNNSPIIQQSFLGFDEDTSRSATEIRKREALLRTSAKIYANSPNQSGLTNFPPLIIPFRWEALQKAARSRKIPLKSLITPVEGSIEYIRKELRQIEETGMGRLLVMSGATGSGKTTFLNSLHYFLEDVDIYDAKDMNLESRFSVDSTLYTLKREKKKHSVVVLEGKEAPGSLPSDSLDILLTALNADFRRDSGHATLFVIPTTSPIVAKAISERAASIGGMTSMARPFHIFEGPQRSQYYSVTNATVKALNDSRTLREYGISEILAKDIANASDSIGSFMQSCYDEIDNQREALIRSAGIHAYGVISKQRKRVHLWMVFCALEKNTRRNHDIILCFESLCVRLWTLNASKVRWTSYGSN